MWRDFRTVGFVWDSSIRCFQEPTVDSFVPKKALRIVGFIREVYRDILVVLMARRTSSGRSSRRRFFKQTTEIRRSFVIRRRELYSENVSTAHH